MYISYSRTMHTLKILYPHTHRIKYICGFYHWSWNTIFVWIFAFIYALRYAIEVAWVLTLR